MIRIFVALVIPDQVKKEITAFRNSIIPDYYKYKWEPEEKIHFTLKFIGEIEEKNLEHIINSLNFIEEYKKINFSLTRFGFFFNRNEAKILWIGLNADKGLFDLVDKLNKYFEQFGIPVEKRAFKAHLSLMRIKNSVDKNFIKKFEDFVISPNQYVAGEVVLIKSELLSAGSRYTELKIFKLK